jgi:hypothetical protein
MMKTSDRHFELKYCERCGALWVRPVDVEEVYCAECGREVDDLPPMSQQAEAMRAPEDLVCDEDVFFERYEEDMIALDPPGGAA